MFGYIKIHKSELKVKEYELYKGLYCSLCKQLGKDYGFLGRMTLNYDFTFFLLCRLAIREQDVHLCASHCSYNPRKKCVCCNKDEDDIVFTAALSILFSYYKIKDDLSDNGLLKKIPSALLLPFFRLKYNKAKNKFPELFEKLESELSRQTFVEKKPSVSLDECADVSAKVLGESFSYLIDAQYKEGAYSFGYNIGRLVYIFDAVDDYEKDKKRGNFNPFVVNKNKYEDNMIESMKQILNISADETAKAYEALPIKRFKAIIENVIFFGFEDTVNGLLLNKE